MTGFFWLFPVAVSLHNLEEGVYFPGYAHLFKPWQTVGVKAFRFALLILTALSYLTTFLSHAGGPRSFGAYLNAGYMVAMLLNVFVPHLAVSLIQKRLMPGTVTAVLLVLPITLLGLVVGLRRNWLEPTLLTLYGVSVTTALLVSLPLLFRLGKRLFRG